MMTSSLTKYSFITFIYLFIVQLTRQEVVEGVSIDRSQDARFKRASPEIISYSQDDKDCTLQGMKASDRLGKRGAIDPCPGGMTFCESVDNYPTDSIKNFLRNQPSILEHLYVEDLPDPNTDRFGEDQVTQLCPTTSRVIYPKKARSREDLYEFVVNDDQHKQGVKVEECLNAGKECEIISNSLPLGYKSFCEQKYVTRTLVVAESKNGGISGIITKPFDIPSCCSCSLVMDGSNRFGIHGPSKSTTLRNSSNNKNSTIQN